MNAAKVLISIEPSKFKQRRYTALGGNLYKDAAGHFWSRRPGGSRGMWKLAAQTERMARIELGKRNHAHHLVGEGLLAPEKDPYGAVQSKATIGDLAKQFLEAQCPKRDGRPKEGKQLIFAQRRVAKLLEHFGKMPWDQVSLGDCTDYYRFRSSGPKKAGCSRDRLIELELAELSSIFRWARRNDKKTGVTSNPIAHERPSFREAKSVRHCREARPVDGDELHQIAEVLLRDRKSQSIGWAVLFAAASGQRISEVLRLKVHASPGEAGFVETRNGKVKRLYQYRSETHKGTFDYVDRETQPALPLLIEAHRAWLQQNYPGTEHYFPSPIRNGAEPIGSMSVNKALARACKILGRKKAVRPHGLRAFRVNQLRSARDGSGRRKYQDAEVADFVGQKSRGTLIVDVYGDPPDEPITWEPKSRQFAWECLTLSRPLQLELGL